MTRKIKKAGLAIASAVAVIGATAPASANPDPVLLAKMEGDWTAALSGSTGCGPTAAYVGFTLDNAGVATGVQFLTNSTCGQTTTTGQTLKINVLNPNGMGLAHLTCGANCGWTFNISVADGGALFILADTRDPKNTLAGTAIKLVPRRQAPEDLKK